MKAFQLSAKMLHILAYRKKTTIFFISILIATNCLQATTQDSTRKEVLLNEWLTVGPFESRLPVFHEEKNLEGKYFKAENLLSSDLKVVEQPIEGAFFLEQENESLYWIKQKTAKSGAIVVTKPNKSDYAIAWQATYLKNQNYSSVTIEIETRQCFILFVDGEKKLSKLKFSKKGKAIPTKKKELNLEAGKHLIVITSLFSKNEETNWEIKTSILAEETDNISLSTAPDRSDKADCFYGVSLYQNISDCLK